MTLRELRRAIDEIDDRLVTLLNERATLALEIGRWKRARGIAMYDPKRESQVLRRVRQRTAARGGPLDSRAISRVFERVIDEARLVEMTDAVTREERVGSRHDGGSHGRTGVGSTGGTGRRHAR